MVPGIGWGFAEDGTDSEIAFETATVSLFLRTSKTRNVLTESSMDAPFVEATPDGTLSAASGGPAGDSGVSIFFWEVRVVVGERGFSRFSVGVRGTRALGVKGPVVEIVVLTGESGSEPLSRGKLSLRNKLMTRELLDRLWVSLSAIISAIEG